MIVVVATSEAELTAVRATLSRYDRRDTSVSNPGGDRRLLLIPVEDEAAAWWLAHELRHEGLAAVARPDGGPRLDAWMRHTLPVDFGDRLSVCFAWSEHDRSALAHVVELGPGGFGNGEHPATRLLVEQLLRSISGGERVLDLGCGSGVLGLCALELGAADVVAVDLKQEAVEATRRNAVLNGVADRVEATTAALDSLDRTFDGAFDVILANVGRGAVVELAPQLLRLLAPAGWLAVSGISPAQCSQVSGFLHPLEETDRQISGEWAASTLSGRARPR